jgi:hypothetical protein
MTLKLKKSTHRGGCGTEGTGFFQICNMLQMDRLFVEADLVGSLIGASRERTPPIGDFTPPQAPL